MRDEKNRVVTLPGVKRSEEVEPRQLTLFFDLQEASNQFVFVDIRQLNERSLIRILVSASVSLVIDLRPAPVFSRPKFKHSNVSEYIHSRNIDYFEYAYRISCSVDANLELQAVLENKGEGLTLCLFDDLGKERGWCEQARQSIRRSHSQAIEINSRLMV